MIWRLKPGHALASVLGALAVASWFPFRPGFEGPYLARNGACLGSDGSLTLDEPAVVRGVPSDWAARARAAESFRLDVSLRAHATDQGGPARVLVLSRDSRHANVLLGQEGDALVLRCRRPGSSPDGEPRLVAESVFDAAHVAGTLPVEVGVLLRDGTLSLSVDGEVRASETVGSRPFAEWSADYEVTFGDEHTRSRPWRGEVRAATVTVDGVRVDLLAPDRVDVPVYFWQVPERARELFALDRGVIVLTFFWHVGVFAAFGGCLALWRRSRGLPSRMPAVAAITLALSVALELGKLGFARRHPSLLHVVPDVSGACAGAWLVLRVLALRLAAPVRGCPSSEEIPCPDSR